MEDCYYCQHRNSCMERSRCYPCTSYKKGEGRKTTYGLSDGRKHRNWTVALEHGKRRTRCQEEEQRGIHHIRMSLWRTRFITGIGMLVGLFYASGAAITYSVSVKAPESTLERVLIGLAVSASFYALNSIARTLEKQIKNNTSGGNGSVECKTFVSQILKTLLF